MMKTTTKDVESSAHEMWRACIARSLQDLFGSCNLTSHKDEAYVVRDDALRFLTATSGGWYRSRVDICTMADLNPDILRQQVVAILEGAAPPDLDGRISLDHVHVAREFWARLKDEEERAAKARVDRANKPKIEPRKPKRSFIKMKYADLRKAVFDLLRDTPNLKFTQILGHWDGDISEHGVRNVLNIGIEKGEVVRAPDFTYHLSTPPASSVERQPEDDRLCA